MLSILIREVASIEAALEGTGFRGMVNVVDARESMVSERVLVRAGAGNWSSEVLSSFSHLLFVSK